MGEIRAWKLFCLLPFLLLRRGGRNERVSKTELCHRFDMFGVGEWERLFDEAIASTPAVPLQAHGTSSSDTMEQRAKVALSKVQMGEVSRARQCLTGATIAAGTDATLQEMQSRRPQEVVRNITQRIWSGSQKPPSWWIGKFSSAVSRACPGVHHRAREGALSSTSDACSTKPKRQRCCTMQCAALHGHLSLSRYPPF